MRELEDQQFDRYTCSSVAGISRGSQSMLVFTSLSEALRAGYQVEGLAANGYIVRTRTRHGWARALVVVSGCR
jgi:hypothetical protein